MQATPSTSPPKHAHTLACSCIMDNVVLHTRVCASVVWHYVKQRTKILHIRINRSHMKRGDSCVVVGLLCHRYFPNKVISHRVSPSPSLPSSLLCILLEFVVFFIGVQQRLFVQKVEPPSSMGLLFLNEVPRDLPIPSSHRHVNVLHDRRFKFL